MCHRYSCAYRKGDASTLKELENCVFGSNSYELLEDYSKNNLNVELDLKVESFLVKVEGGKWGCTVCAYTCAKAHVREHIEEHIEGYSHPCETCDKVF